MLYHRWHCTGRIHTLGEKILKTTIHNHVPDKAYIEARKGIENLKTMAAQVGPSTQLVIASISEGLSASAAATLPTPPISSMKRTVQRQKLEDFPAIPNSLLELNIPENSQITSDSSSESNSTVQTPLFTTLYNETPSTSSKVPILRRTMPKKRNAQEAIIDKMSSCFYNLNKRVQSAPTPDEDLHFARSLAQDIKILTPLQKIQFKRTIYELLENVASETL
ncbi:unnamed protein product [Brassicogethes aeneus]|uniref:BESS domain-containing protein n=1 Tax=Brassicogethes aeneus TaxID=1431903 RepID=A0A9P0FCS7_BRAAE|nr:unnamed protein product [Brassicogethes aeneus]